MSPNLFPVPCSLFPVLGPVPRSLFPLFVLVCAITFFGRVDYTISDPFLSLVAAQELVGEGTMRLDRVVDRIDSEKMYAVREWGGRAYYFFPPGPVLLAVPVVWLANRFGGDMLERGDNRLVQRGLAAGLAGLIFLVFYGIGRNFLPHGSALVIALVTALGSPVSSTIGAAYWSSGPAALGLALALWLLARDRERPALRHPVWLGLALAAAYLCRPTSAFLIAPLLVYVWLRHRPGFWPLAGTLAAAAGVFIGHAWLTYGQLLPPYYALSRFDRTYQAGLVLFGHLASPSRGWLVFSPVFAAVFLGLALTGRTLAREPLVWLALAWIAGHLAAVSHIGHWFGGHSYGPRLLAELTPAVVLLTVLVWRALRARAGRRGRRAALAVYLLLGALSIWIHVAQGLYNPSTAAWNGAPNIDDYPEYVWDWRYPQFLASPPLLADRAQAHRRRLQEE